MSSLSFRRGMRAVAFALLTLAAFSAGAGCGKSSGGDLTDPGPSDPSDPVPTDPTPAPGPAPVGDVIYAVDLSNNFLVFGSGSIGVLTQKLPITGLPILKRIIGLAIRQSDGKLYGVGNDSRVYTIDPMTAVATPIGPEFAPKIASFFDIHFAMSLEPNGERVRLIAVESGGNWSISLADGSASFKGNVRYADGSGLDGRTPSLLGIVYTPYPPEASAGARATASSDPLTAPHTCENLMYAIDIDEALMVAACDPDTGEFWPVGDFPFEGFERCGEVMAGPDGATRPEGVEPPTPGLAWHPPAPDTPFWVFLNKVGEAQNKSGYFTPAQSMLPSWQGEVPSAEPIQSVVWAKGGLYGPSSHKASHDRHPAYGVAPRSSNDPRAHCGTSAT